MVVADLHRQIFRRAPSFRAVPRNISPNNSLVPPSTYEVEILGPSLISSTKSNYELKILKVCTDLHDVGFGLS